MIEDLKAKQICKRQDCKGRSVAMGRHVSKCAPCHLDPRSQKAYTNRLVKGDLRPSKGSAPPPATNRCA